MSSLTSKDRVSLCTFTFSDGRRCRTPRISNHPHFCFYHAQKEARARAAETLGKDLAYFFSGDYLSACDLSTALARLIPAVVRGDVKPKTAHTVAYMAQTLMQAIHISQHEYINAFGTDGWRKSVRNSVNGNYDYRFPLTPSEAEGPVPDSDNAPEPEQSRSPQPQPQPAAQPAPVAHTGIHPACPEHLGDPVGRGEATSTASPHSPIPTQAPPTPAHPTQPPFSHSSPSSPGCHPERSEGSQPIPTTPFTRSAASAPQPENSPRPGPSTPQPAPNRDARAVHFDHNCRLLIDGKPF